MSLHHALLGDKLLNPAPQTEQPAHVQSAIACAVRAFLIERLNLLESDAEQVKSTYGLPASIAYVRGYRSAPKLERSRLYSVDGQEVTAGEVERIVSQRLDALDDEQFFDEIYYGDSLAERARQLLRRSSSRDVSLTSQLDAIEQEIAERFGDVSDVPGFYYSDKLRVKLPPYGLIVPCRQHGDIVNLQIYSKPSTEKFYWLSSTSNGQLLPGGAAAKATLHISNEGRASSGVCIVARHTVEADALAFSEAECAVAVNGVNPLWVARDLRRLLPDVRAAILTFEDSFLERTLRENHLKVRTVGVGGQADV